MADMPTWQDWMKGAGHVPVSPLMAHPMATAAAVTAVGIGMASHASGMMFGYMQAMLEASQKSTLPVDETNASASVTSPKADARTPVMRAKEKPDAKVAAKSSSTGVAKLKSVAYKASGAAKETKPAKTTASVETSSLQPTASRPKEMRKPPKPDDLKLISGVGPKLEELLNTLGIWKFSQISKWSDAEVNWVDDYMQFGGRIERDGWVEQARKFGSARSKK